MPGEGEDGVENDTESDVQHTRSRPLLPRTSKDPTEPIESETSTTVEKIVNHRSSNRITKRARRDSSPVDTTVKKAANTKQNTPVVVSKTRRPWELWSVEDKDAFFEALCEFGKDFENIQSYIAQRSKKKGVAANMIKNKDQVRHFYYRTWHKISKFLQISESVTKQTQELYGLINYGELRKKIGGCLNEKNRQKLNELVFSGVTTVKHKGKKLRIKTPVCRALKKLNNVTDTKEPEAEKMPKEIVIEFRPHTNAAFLQVQTLAQNPRVRTKLTLQKRLKPVIEFLQNRWKPYRLKRKEQILASLPSLASQETCDNDIAPMLRVKPPRDAKIFPLTLSVMDVASSSDVCLQKFMKLSHKIVHKDINKAKKSLCLNQKILNDKQSDLSDIPDKQEHFSENAIECTDNALYDLQELLPKTGNRNNIDDGAYFNVLTPPKSVPENLPNETFVDSQNPLSLFTSILEATNINAPYTGNDNLCEKLCNENLNSYSTELNFRSYDNKTTKCDEIRKSTATSDSEKVLTFCQNIPDNMTLGEYLGCAVDKFSFDNIQSKEKNSLSKPLDSKDVDQGKNDNIYYRTIQNGWTAEEAGYLTFGEIYLLLGKPPKIILEYEFEPPEAIFSYSEKDSNSTQPPPTEMSVILNKMCEMAQIYFTDSKSKQILNKQSSRSSKSSKTKMSLMPEKVSKELPPSTSVVSKPTQVKQDAVIENCKDGTVKKSSMNSVTSISSHDKHIFVRPVGTAPRNIKPPDQNSLKEEIGKLLPSTRRGCRVRRKPLVVQRPLLPREGMGSISGPRPMTLVHLVPSVSPLTTVLPPNCTHSEKKNMPVPKKIVKILPPGPSIDIHPMQVPVINQMQNDSRQNVIMQQNSGSNQHVLNSTSRNPLQILNDQTASSGFTPSSAAISSSNAIITDNPATLESSFIPETELPSPTILDVLNFDLLSESQPAPVPDESFVTIPSSNTYQLSDQSDPLSNISAIPDTSFLEGIIGISTKRPLFDSSGTSNFTEESFTPKPLSTPPGSPQQSFLMNSPDRQWLNGEGPDLSLNTFLNVMESPSKILSTSSSSFTENSNFDQIARLAPVVDSQVRCLLDECSIDFIAKFEDLADVIINSSSNDGKQT